MTDNNRETGSRKLAPKEIRDAADDFSQDAAENRKPPLGTGLTEKVNETMKRPVTRMARKRLHHILTL